MDLLRHNGSLDRKYLRVAAVYRLLKKGKIGKRKAIELLAARHTATEMISLNNTVQLWARYSIKDMLP